MPLGWPSAPASAAARNASSGALVVSQYERRAASACAESLPSGEDVSGGRLTVGQQRLYRLVTLPKVEDRTVTIELAPGISAYAFTFG